MPLPGPLVHQLLMDAYARLQSELAETRNTILQSGQQREQLDVQRDEALARLAEYYLPELTDDAVGETWLEVRESITLILRRKEDHASQTKMRLDDLATQQADRERRLVEINGELDTAVQQQSQIIQQIEQTLREDAQFVALSDRAAMAEVAIERAEANLAEIDQDAARKLPAYEQSSLFQYLYSRQYGTPQYGHRGLTRQMDRWLARYIDYSHAKKGYDFLRRTPDHMREILAEDRESLETVMSELERRRDEIAKSHGLSEVTERCGRLEQEREQLLKQLDQVLVETERVQQDWVTLQDPRGSYYREAIARFRESLGRMSSRDLKRRAEKTKEITDDQIVARLLGVESDMEQLDRQARDRHGAVKNDYVFLEDLGRLIQRFRAAQFDSARSQFVDSLDLEDEVRYAREDVNIDRLWKRLRKCQRWAPSAGDTLTQVATHPLTQVLINAMAHAAGGAMAEHARRAGKRHGNRDHSWKKWSEGFGSWGDWSWGDSNDRRRRR
jgi:hypothetical protein